MAVITLNSKLDSKHPLDYVRRIAIHEVLHVVMADFCDLAEPHNNSKLVDTVEHKIINRLTNLLAK